MASFQYRAVRSPGQETVEGDVEARTRQEAYQKLIRQDLRPVWLKEGASLSGATSTDTAEASRNTLGPGEKVRLKRAELILFTDELSDLLEAGLQLDTALRVLEERAGQDSLRLLTVALRKKIRDGSSFAAALRTTSPDFGELYCNLVSAGEASGALAPLLRRQASYLQVIDELRARVIQALTYPLFIMVAGVIVITLFLTVLVPQFSELFRRTGMELPLLTRALIATGDIFMSYWWLMAILVAGGIMGFMLMIRDERGRLFWDQQKLRMPLMGTVLSASFYAQFSQTLANLLSNGIPLLQALNLVNEANQNRFLKQKLKRAVDLVAEGASLSYALRKVGGFPPLLIDFIATGEQTGDLDHALRKAGQRYDKDFSRTIERMTNLIQPLAILAMAILVGILAYSIVTAIFQSISAIRVS